MTDIVQVEKNTTTIEVVQPTTAVIEVVKGIKGDPSTDPGPQGLTGKSAYELAVQNGFVGTEPQWLDSLTDGAASGAYDLLIPTVNLAVEDAVEAHTPGIELGYAERLTNFTTTSTGLGSYIPELTFTIVGQGRPADIEFYCSAVRHSVAGTGVTVYFEVNGAVNLPQCQAGTFDSPLTTAGRTGSISHRAFLTSGVSYTYKVCVFGQAAGTCTLNGSAAASIQLRATSR